MKHLIALLVLFGACAVPSVTPDDKRAPPPPRVPTCGPDVDIVSDPLNCGGCGNACTSGLCYSGVCADATAGHAFAIGHGYASSNGALDRILGNAIFLTDRNPVRVLAYVGSSPAELVAGTDAAIARYASARARTFTTTKIANSADVQVLISSADVFLVYPQPGVDNLYLNYLGDEWSIPLSNFARGSGVVVVLDTPSDNGGAAGTAEILRRTGLMALDGRANSTPHGYLTDPSDVGAREVPMIIGMSDSVGWTSIGNSSTVVTDEGGLTDVAHHAIY